MSLLMFYDLIVGNWFELLWFGVVVVVMGE